MIDSALELQSLLRSLIEQQTALLNAQVESIRLQRVLIEQLLASGDTSSPAIAQGSAIRPELSPTHLPSPTPPGPQPESRPVTNATPNSQPSIQDERTPGDGTDLPPVAEPVAGKAEEDRSEQPFLTVAPGRGERYYRGPPAAGPAPLRSITLEGLEALRRIQATVDIAHLVLTFGPHAGEPLGQVAQSDPDYLRRLATTAQRADVRAAAARLVEALPAAEPPHRRQWHRRGGRQRGAT